MQIHVNRLHGCFYCTSVCVKKCSFMCTEEHFNLENSLSLTKYQSPKSLVTEWPGDTSLFVLEKSAFKWESCVSAIKIFCIVINRNY